MGGPTTRTRAPNGLQQVDIRAGNPAVQDIATYGHEQSLKVATAPTNGDRIQQCLGRVLMPAVAGVDDRTVDLFREQLDRAAFRVAHHQHVGMHGVERDCSIEQRLALLDGAGTDGHVDHVRAQTFAGELETGPRAGRAFKEDVDDRPAL